MNTNIDIFDPTFPYPGLRPFERHETMIFFGREHQVNQLVDKIGKHHFIAVVGTPSLGKSSLIKTGFLSGLERNLLAKAGDYWHFVEFSPENSEQAFSRFGRALEASMDNEEIKDTLKNENLKELQNLIEEKLIDNSIAIKLLKALIPIFKEWNILFIIDQFEEIFSDKSQKAKIGKFINFILDLSKHSKVYIIITMRSGYINECSEYRELAEAINEGLYVVPPLSESQLKEAIEKPALMFDDKISLEVTETLIEEMQDKPEYLPLMQHALALMWRRARADPASRQADGSTLITIKHYEEIGGSISKALSENANQIYFQLDEEQQYITQIIFKNLTRREENRADIRNPTHIQNIANQTNNQIDADCSKIIEVADIFRHQGVYLLKPYKEHKEELDSDDILDISHESLVSNWNKCSKWASEEKQAAETYRVTKDRVKVWLENGKKATDLDSGSKFKEAWNWYQGDSESKGFWASNFPELFHSWKALKAKLSGSDKDEKDSTLSFRPNKFWASRYDGEKYDFGYEAVEEFIQTSSKNIIKNNRKVVTRYIISIASILTAIGIILWATFYIPPKIEAYNQTFSRAQLLIKQEEYQQSLNVFAETEKFDFYISATNFFTDTHKITRNWLKNYANLMSSTPTSNGFKLDETPDGLQKIQLTDTVDQQAVVYADNAGIFFWSLSDKPFNPIPLPDTTDAVDITLYPQTNLLAVANKNGTVQQFDIALPQQAPKNLYNNQSVNIYAIAANAKQQLAISTEGYGPQDNIEHNIVLTSSTGNTLLFDNSNPHNGIIRSLAFIPKQPRLISGANDKTAKLWDTNTGQLLYTFIGHADNITHVTVNPDGQLLATSSSDGTIRLWNIETRQLYKELRGHNGAVSSAKFFQADNNVYLISASQDLTLRLWDVVSGKRLSVWEGHQSGVNDIAVTDTQIYSIDKDSRVLDWTMDEKINLINFEPHIPTATFIDKWRDYIFVGFDDGQLCLIPEPYTQVSQCVTAHQQRIRRIIPMQERHWATVSREAITIWTDQYKKISPVHTYYAQNAEFLDIVFSDAQYRLYVLDSERRLSRIDLQPELDRKPVLVNLDLAPQAIKRGNIALSTYGEYILFTDLKTGWLWNVFRRTPELRYTFELPEVSEVTFSPDNRKLAIIDYNKAVLYDYSIPVRPKEVARFIADERIIKAKFILKGYFLAAVSADSRLTVWDVNAQNELFSIQLPADAYPQAATYNPNPVLDFDMECIALFETCMAAVPLTNHRLAIYDFGRIY